jgi:hypothetical protein
MLKKKQMIASKATITQPVRDKMRRHLCRGISGARDGVFLLAVSVWAGECITDLLLQAS